MECKINAGDLGKLYRCKYNDAEAATQQHKLSREIQKNEKRPASFGRFIVYCFYACVFGFGGVFILL